MTLGVIAIELKTTVLCLFVVVCCCVRCSGRSEAGPKNGREKFCGSIFHTDPFFTRVGSDIGQTEEWCEIFSLMMTMSMIITQNA